jgi:GNAT superfamily N-acetyltransferase
VPVGGISPIPEALTLTSTDCGISAESQLSASEMDDLWSLFVVAFEPLRHRAAARHVLTREEFVAEVSADQVIRLVGRNDEGRAVALATMSTDIDVFDWINADFYTERFGSTSVFYVGLVVIDPAHQGGGLLSPLIDAILERVRDEGGVLAFDLCAFNDSRMLLSEKTLARARLLSPARSEILDTQTYYCISFDPVAEKGS